MLNFLLEYQSDVVIVIPIQISMKRILAESNLHESIVLQTDAKRLKKKWI